MSKALGKSIDELVGNELELPTSIDKSNNTAFLRNICVGLAAFCSSIAGVWAFSANRFRYDEILLITAAGIIGGVCLGLVCHSILVFLKNKAI